MDKSPLISSIIIGFVSGVVLYGILVPQTIIAESEGPVSTLNFVKVVENGPLKFCKPSKSPYDVVRTVEMVITAYSSTKEQTDDTPFITASGKYVKDGIIANNMLPFGTKIRIPELYGDKIFTIEDRMHKRKGMYQADIWFAEYEKAKEFGAKIAHIEILES